MCERSEHQWQGRGDGGDPQVLGSRNPNPDPKFEKVSEASDNRYKFRLLCLARVVCGCYDAYNEWCDKLYAMHHGPGCETKILY